ncbi:hypothetical protein GCM10010377_54030 [Streptomyces viridiviolaceus]|nr:hypothetical protein GCM10010377_54030 [Streptomyces viridiviolaceus]
MRDGLEPLSAVVGFGVLVLSVAGVGRWFARESAPVLFELPGGSWADGGVLGLVSVQRWVGVAGYGFTNRTRVSTFPGPEPRSSRTPSGRGWSAGSAIGGVVRAVAERQARERERLRKPRKKGEGKEPRCSAAVVPFRRADGCADRVIAWSTSPLVPSEEAAVTGWLLVLSCSSPGSF